MKIIAAPEAWEEMEAYYHEDPFSLSWEIYSNFIQEALYKIRKPGIRGRHKARAHFVQDMKIKACWLERFFAYWVKKPLEQWPSYLKSITISKEDKLNIKKLSGKLDPIALTAFYLESAHGKEAKKHKLNPFFDNLENFRITYVSDNVMRKKIKEYINGLNEDKMKDLPYNNTFIKDVFKRIGVLEASVL